MHQAQAGLRQAEEDLSRTTIVSPIDGKVVQLNAHEGEVVVTGTMNNPGSVIAVIADLSQILVEAEVGETEVVGIRRSGSRRRSKSTRFRTSEYRGHVVEIGSSAAVRQGAGAGIRYFKVKVAIDDADDRLRPGMTSQVSIVTSSAPNAVDGADPVGGRARAGRRRPTTRRTTTSRRRNTSSCARKDGKAKQVEVTTGISDATHVAILSGVKAGDR